VKTVLLLAGPTASGKSALAIEIAEEFGGTIVNADAMQLYRELEIVTARPDAQALARAPHRLYGVSPATDIWSAARWRDAAIAEIAACGDRLPILAGGTGLYFRALLHGFAHIPPIAPEFRERARARREAIGADAFHAEIARFDPVIADRLPPGDSQRLMRAWEVFTATGRALSAWQTAPREGPPPGLSFRTLLLDPPRASLYALIDARVETMVANGAVDELVAVETLDPLLPLRKAVGVAELLAFRRGETDLATAIDRAQQATRNYAKRQATWFRHQIMADLRLNEQLYYQNRPEIFRFIRSLG
jgi:tRNA dimethylallyltransferase